MSDKCIFITGASSDTAMTFLEERGDKYSLIYAHYLHENERFAVLKEKYADRFIPLKADLSSQTDIEAMIGRVKERGIFPDHFLHIASDKMTGSKFHKREASDFKQGFDISVSSAVMLLQPFMEQMMKKKYGRVIFMLTSCTIGEPPKYQSAYVTQKYALLGLMKALAAEYANKGITVNGISPEMMDTKFLDGMLKKEVILKESAERNPLGRNITPGDVIPVINYLLSDAAEAVTGQNIAITGGLK